MKAIKKSIVSVSAAALLFLLSHCSKSGGDAIKIEGFTLTDYNGDLLSYVGPRDSDWLFISKLSAKELALFDFSTPFSLDNTFPVNANFDRIGVYPNPASAQQFYGLSASDSILMKIVVVNSSLKVLAQHAIKAKGPVDIGMDFHDRSVYPNGAVYRVYFSLSAKDRENYKFGYGDIKICDDTNVTNCF